MNWMNELSDFFNERGINKNLVTSGDNNEKVNQDFTAEEYEKIRHFSQTVVSPAFQILSKELNTFDSITADIAAAKKETPKDAECPELKISRIMQLKFIYKSCFFRLDNHIIFAGYYSLANMYGNPTGFEKTGLISPLETMTQEMIMSDLIRCLKTHASM
jgi:hypothetical protein